jgi:nucleoside-diphosphate-sugar epimerase
VIVRDEAGGGRVSSEGRVLVTGATGYIGGALADALAEAGRPVVATHFSRPPRPGSPALEWHCVGPIGATTAWDEALEGVDTVVHAAGLAHVPEGPGSEERAREVNARGTLRLARCAAERGVRRFVYLSSVHVLGARTGADPFDDDTAPAPAGVYARSKHEAELGLWEIASATGMAVIVVRPPLVYGPNAPGNFGRLLRLVRTGVPLPFASVRNARSLISIGNLVDLLSLCVRRDAVAAGAYVVSDGEDVSTPEMLRLMALGLGVQPRLVHCPPGMLRVIGRLLGRAEEIAKLCDSLAVDARRIREQLAWNPRERPATAIVEAARAVRSA